MTQFKIIHCNNCDRELLRRAGWVRENNKFGYNFYCSQICESEYKRTVVETICENTLCNKYFLREPSHISQHNYCSRSCGIKINNQKRAVFKSCPQCAKKFKGGNMYCSISCAKTGRRGYTENDLIKSIQITQEKLKRVPAKREVGPLAEASINVFGSWNKAIIAAGFQPNRSHDHRMYKRVITKAADGHSCDSISEAIIDDWLSKNNISHQRTVQYPHSNHSADWSIGKGIFVEYFGLANDSPRYDRDMENKKKICEQNRIQLIAIYPSDLYPEIKLENKLHSFVTA